METTIIHYGGQAILANVIGEAFANDDEGTEPRCHRNTCLLRDEAGDYYLRRETHEHPDKSLAAWAAKHPGVSGYRCRVHAVSLRAAILWAVAVLPGGDSYDLRRDVNRLEAGSMDVNIRDYLTNAVLDRISMGPDMSAAVKGFGAALRLDFDGAILEIMRRSFGGWPSPVTPQLTVDLNPEVKAVLDNYSARQGKGLAAYTLDSLEETVLSETTALCKAGIQLVFTGLRQKWARIAEDFYPQDGTPATSRLTRKPEPAAKWTVPLSDDSARELQAFCVRYSLKSEYVLAEFCEGFLTPEFFEDRTNREGTINAVREREERAREETGTEDVSHEDEADINAAVDRMRAKLDPTARPEESRHVHDPEDVCLLAAASIDGDDDEADEPDVATLPPADKNLADLIAHRDAIRKEMADHEQRQGDEWYNARVDELHHFNRRIQDAEDAARRRENGNGEEGN